MARSSVNLNPERADIHHPRQCKQQRAKFQVSGILSCIADLLITDVSNERTFIFNGQEALFIDSSRLADEEYNFLRNVGYK
jgi:hypothetical protein